MTEHRENESLELLTPPPEEKLLSWLGEFYGKSVAIEDRELLRHRDLSYVERLHIGDGLPTSLIYKLVLPPWDVEQDLHERILIPSISNSAQLYLSAHHGPMTALFMEDLGYQSLKNGCPPEIATTLGEELAKMHRSYCYRTDELSNLGILRVLSPIDYEKFVSDLADQMLGWQLSSKEDKAELVELAKLLAQKLAGEPISLVHGDLFAENIIIRSNKLLIIDWSWFTMLGVPLTDLATLTMNSPKNAEFVQYQKEVVEAYSYESGRVLSDIEHLLPFAQAMSRVLFWHWLIERKSRGIRGTTVGPVEGVIQTLVQELRGLKATLLSL